MAATKDGIRSSCETIPTTIDVANKKPAKNKTNNLNHTTKTHIHTSIDRLSRTPRSVTSCARLRNKVVCRKHRASFSFTLKNNRRGERCHKLNKWKPAICMTYSMILCCSCTIDYFEDGCRPRTSLPPLKL